MLEFALQKRAFLKGLGQSRSIICVSNGNLLRLGTYTVTLSDFICSFRSYRKAAVLPGSSGFLGQVNPRSQAKFSKGHEKGHIQTGTSFVRRNLL